MYSQLVCMLLCMCICVYNFYVCFCVCVYACTTCMYVIVYVYMCVLTLHNMMVDADMCIHQM